MTRIGQTILHEAAAEAVRWAVNGASAPASGSASSPGVLPPTWWRCRPHPCGGRAGAGPADLRDPSSCSLATPSRREHFLDLAALGSPWSPTTTTGRYRRAALPFRSAWSSSGWAASTHRDRRRAEGAGGGDRRPGPRRAWLCVGKGVETAAQAAILRDLGCHGGQGFLFSGARSRRGAVHVPRRRGRLGPNAAGAIHPRGRDRASGRRRRPKFVRGPAELSSRSVQRSSGDDHSVFRRRGEPLPVEGDRGPVLDDIDPEAASTERDQADPDQFRRPATRLPFQ